MKKIRSIAALAAVATMAVAGSAGAASHDGVASAAAKKDIVETAAGAGQFDTLAALVEKAGLAKTLEGKGPYTVFAPTDAAFAKLPKGKLRSLKRHPKRLKAVLLYHVAAGKLTAKKVAKRNSVKTLNGQRVSIRTRGKTVRVGGARVTAANVGASNGVIHVIDRVLIPR
jgi:uncharacterized surface protein with fasciclin (FAS1) repeats